MTEPTHVSYSSLSLYARCPLAWRFAYVDREQRQESEACIRGRLVHEFAEMYGRHCIEAGLPRDWEWADEQAVGYRDDGLGVERLCRAFARQVEFNRELVVADGEGVEREVAADLPDGLGKFKGRVDLVEYATADGRLFVTDYKSSWAQDRPDEPPAQLMMYGWALLRMPQFSGACDVMLRAHYIGNGITHEWWVGPDELRPDWAVALARRIAADKRFEATPSPHACAWCDYTHVCPYAAGTGVTITCAGDAEDALRRIVAHEADLKRLRNAVSAWVREHGPVSAAGKVAYRGRPAYVVERDGAAVYDGEYVLKRRVDRQRAAEALIDAGLDEDEVTEVLFPDPDPKALGRLLALVERDEDPFGYGEADTAAEALRGMMEPRKWNGAERFRIDTCEEEDVQ